MKYKGKSKTQYGKRLQNEAEKINVESIKKSRKKKAKRRNNLSNLHISDEDLSRDPKHSRSGE